MLSLSNWWVWNFGPHFNCFGHKLSLEKIFLDAQETEFLTKSFSDSHDSACFFDIISPTCPGRFYYKHYYDLVALQRLIFSKRYTKCNKRLFSRIPIKMYKLFGFWRANFLVDKPTCTNDIIKPEPAVEPRRLKLLCSGFFTPNECWGNWKFLGWFRNL